MRWPLTLDPPSDLCRSCRQTLTLAGRRNICEHLECTVPAVLLPQHPGCHAQAVSAARGAWGERATAELDAEDRLAVACERAPTTDPVIAKLRAAFQARA